MLAKPNYSHGGIRMSLHINHVRRSFGPVLAVRDVWLEAPEGSIMGIIGPNGSGKTTTMRLVLRILMPEKGNITWAERSVEHWPLGTFGYLPEERGLYPQMTGRAELRFFGRLHGLSLHEADKEIAHWGDALSLTDLLDKKVDELSKGNAQKLQFLAAVLHRPKLVILDEPFSGLDPMNTRVFKNAIRRLHELGSTILFSSHQMDYVEELCDRVCLITEGRTVAHGTVDGVRRQSGARVLTIQLQSDTDGFDQLNEWPGVRQIDQVGTTWRYELQPGVDADAILRLVAQQGRVQRFLVDYPSLEDVYIACVSKYSEQVDVVNMTQEVVQ